MSLRLMCITAHPDDESGAFGGALMMAQAAGVETSVICLTAGEAATNRGSAQSAKELTQIRRAEFAAAAAVLAVGHFEILAYPDGQLASQDFAELTSVLVERIRRHRPQVVLTFGSDGGANLHRDHIIVALAATAAFQFAGRSAFAGHSALAGQSAAPIGSQPYSAQKLYYSCPPFLVAREPEDAEKIAQTPCSLVLELGALKRRKLEAFLKHQSQTAVTERFQQMFEEHGERERYLLIASRLARPITDDQSLFAGVTED